MRRDVFQAIADTTRREIINIAANNNINLNAMADHFNISRPAISKHLKILSECGLIEIRKEGRDRYCEANLGKLVDVSHWVDQYRTFWTGRLKALDQQLDNKKITVKKSTSKKTSSL